MKKLIRFSGIFLSTLLLWGCFQVDTVVRVKKDGSGTIEERMVMGQMFISQMKMMSAQMGAMGGESAGGGEFSLIEEDKLRARAAQMGEGVTFVKADPLTTPQGGEGYTAHFSFEDVRKLKVNQNPSDAVPSESGGESGPAKEYIVFDFEAGSTPTLKVIMPEEKDEAEAPEQPEAPGSPEEMGGPPGGDADGDEMAEQMKMMFQEMRISMAIEVEGDIVETNASHREGSRITLMEMDFGKLLQNPEKFAALQSTGSKNLEGAKELMKDLPGIKVELERELQVKFK